MDRLLSAHIPELRRTLDVRVVYSDLDGTMLGRGGSFVHSPDGVLTGEPAAVLLEAAQRGIEIVPATGRSLRGLLGDARILGLTTVIAEMGAIVAYEVGREVVMNLGDYPGGEEAPVTYMERTGAVKLLFDSFPGRVEHHTPWSAWREYTHLLRGLVDTAEADRILAEGGFGWLRVQDNGLLSRGYLGLEAGSVHAYHVLPRGVDKGSAVALDMGRRGLSREHVIAVGDAIADLSMAAHVGALILVADAVAADHGLAEAAASISNAYVSSRPGNLGWCDALRTVAMGASASS